MEFPRRVFDGEGVKADVDFGPTLMLNRNRCILCTRCVRFMREIDGDAQINIVDRGYGSEIATFQEEGVHSLLSGNLMDVCPVGAITTRDYRFKSRPWDNPEAVDTICTFCEKGCNTTAWLKAKPEWAKGARLVRTTPRFNPDVNGYWMCDIGRFDYHWIEGDDRLQRAAPARGDRDAEAGRLARGADARRPIASTAVGGTGAMRFLLSAHASLEELFLLGRLGAALRHCRRTASRSAGACARSRSRPTPSSRSRRSTRPTFEERATWASPSARPPTATPDLAAFRQQVEQRRVKALYVFDPGPDGSIGDVSWIIDARAVGQAAAAHRAGRAADRSRARGRHRAARAPRRSRRTRSTSTSRAGCRRAARALPPPGDAQEDWQILVNLGARAGRDAGLHEQRARARRTSPRAMAAQRALRRASRTGVRAAGRGAALAAGVQSVGALEVGRHVPGPAAGEVRRVGREPSSIPGRDLAAEGRLSPASARP